MLKMSRFHIYSFPFGKGEHAITSQAYRQINKLTDGVEHVGNHTLRKTFGYWFYKATKDIAILQKILHQSHSSVALRYIGILKKKPTTY
ncbi:hypothetical protein ASG65_17990 [Bacillus sp. Leaf13]|nr:hypothetical protein ASG65_17990 [Bacillus sp. Leaf13]